jgi:glycosyltransferase involved in cell wall biosynthesis
MLWLVERISRQHELVVFSLNQSPRNEIFSVHGATVHKLGLDPVQTPGLGLLKSFQRLSVAYNQYEAFDVIHGFWVSMPGLLAALIAKKVRIPSVLSIAGGELSALPEIGYGGQRTWRGRLKTKAAMKLATIVTSATPHIDEQARTLGINPVRLPLGCHIDPMIERSAKPKGPPWRLLSVGSLNRVKDHKTLLQAMAILVKELPDVHLDIIGVDQLNGEIQAAAKRLSLDSHVQFHGFVPSSKLTDFYKQAHVLVVSSLHEAGPLVALEAAAMGTPTVGTKVGHIAQWSPDRAVAVPVQNPSALANELLKLLRDEDKRENLSNQAYLWARQYDADFTATELIRTYSRVLNRSTT